MANIFGSPSSNEVSESGKNSSTTVLSSGATFTGAWEDAKAWNTIVIAVKTDQNGTFTVQFSPDGVNADSTLTRYYRTDQIEPPHAFRITRRYCRVTFTNSSASAQTYFRLQTRYDATANPLNAPLDAVLSQDYDSIVVRPSIAQDEITRGLRQGVTQWNKFAYRTATTAAGGEQTVWATNVNYTILTSASTFTITYNSGTDGLGTTGALSLLFYYLDANEALTTATHVLGNTGSDVTSFTGLGINRIVVLSSGTANVNTNDITITATTGGTVQGIIPALGSVTQQAIFHVPINHTAVLKTIVINANKLSGSNPIVLFKMYTYNRGTDTIYEVLRKTIDTSVENTVLLIDPVNFANNSRDVIYFIMDTDRDSTIASIRFSLNLYKNVSA